MRQKGIIMKDRIKQIRIDSNLNQSEFGERVGATVSTVSTWELGKRIPTEISIKSICREFNVNYAWLVDGVGPMYQEAESEVEEFCNKYNMTDPDEIYLVETFCNLDAKERKQFINTVRKLIRDNKSNK